MSILADLWRSARSFARTPALALALVLCIAVGVGSTAVLHGFARGLTVRASPELAAGFSRVAALLELTAGAVWFIAAINVALLLVARSSARSRETSIRVALGSSRARLVRHLLADGVVLTAEGARQVGAGVLAGAAISRLAVRWLSAAAPDAGAPTLRMYLAAAMLLVIAAALAIVSPARSVLTVDPLTLLDDRPAEASSN